MRGEMRLNLIIRLERAEAGADYDRTGLKPQMRDVLGTEIPYMVLPVAPGRDMAHVIEVAALNQKLKQLGHDAAKELDERVVKMLSKKGRIS